MRLILPPSRPRRRAGALALLITLALGAPPDSLAQGDAPDSLGLLRLKRAQEKLVLGLALERRHQPAAAIAAYRRAVALDSTIGEANYRMGLLFLTVDQVKVAAQCFVQEVKRHPEHHEAHRQLGLAFARLDQPRAALRELETLTRKYPRDADDWAALGFAYMHAGRSGGADSALRRAILLRPREASWHRDLGSVLASRGEEAAARAQFRRAMELAPGDASPWINLGNLESRARRLDAALTAYRSAEARDSGSALAMEGEAQVLRELRRDHEAGDVYARWLARRPDDHGARLDAVRLYDELGRQDISLEIAREGVRADAASPDARLILGMALQSSDDWRGGLDEMRRAEGLFKSNDDRARARALIAAMRAQAPDSLRAFFVADSVAHEGMLDSPSRVPGSAR